MNVPVILDVPEPLSEREQKLLTQLEAEIEQNLKGFKRVGYALMVIRDQRLYRINHDTFEDYCREIWDLGRPRAYQLIDSYTVIQNLSPMGDKMSTMVDKNQPAFDILPENERQARPLTILTPDQQIAAWQMVIAAANEQGGKITADLVQRCINTLLHKKVSGAVGNARNTGERQKKVMPEEIQEVFTTMLDLVQRAADSNWRQIGKKELARALREVLEAIED
jgi:hypothetical protein